MHSTKSSNVVLRRPSQFGVKTRDLDLKSPSTFCMKESDKKHHVVTPSDFVNNKKKSIKDVLVEQYVPPGQYSKPAHKMASEISPKITAPEYHLPFSQNKEFFKEKYLQLEIKYTNDEKKVEQLNMKLQEQYNVFVNEKLELQNKYDKLIAEHCQKIENLEVKNRSLDNNLQKVERNHFNEIKIVYDKYIAFQTQFDEEKRFLVNKIKTLEQQFSDCSDQKSVVKSEVDKMQVKIKETSEINSAEISNLENIIKKLNLELDNTNQKLKLSDTEKMECSTDLEKIKLSIQELEKELQVEKSLTKDYNSKIEQKDEEILQMLEEIKQNKELFQLKMENIGRKLEEERNQKALFEADLNEKNMLVTQLENKLAQASKCIKDLNKNIEKQNITEKQMKLQREEIEMLQYTCRTLQSTNELLNVRLSSVNDMLKLQDVSSKGVLSGEKYDKLLKMWREKVYSLLVLLKTYELKERRYIETTESEI